LPKDAYRHAHRLTARLSELSRQIFALPPRGWWKRRALARLFLNSGKLQSSRTHAQQAAEDLKSAAGVIAGEYRDKTEQAWAEAKDRVRTFQQDADQYVRANPTKAVFIALGIGFVLGLVFRR
jgi:ElaB/YqjD/DUF883 family membrane-anchored ribosome-binding protein